eukprot:Lithocolla_globosa_v1_NODE_3176_length_1740_cov_8.779228.p2 type:complete len:112 gc:universal NODE_3176_length_1740_cov_8.779228:1160-825(-)
MRAFDWLCLCRYPKPAPIKSDTGQPTTNYTNLHVQKKKKEKKTTWKDLRNIPAFPPNTCLIWHDKCPQPSWCLMLKRTTTGSNRPSFRFLPKHGRSSKNTLKKTSLLMLTS